jgi:hypothetical protein
MTKTLFVGAVGVSDLPHPTEGLSSYAWIFGNSSSKTAEASGRCRIV